ncbi:hypothetical protein [Salinicola tamaricis]|uniref:hypothetical protein n=1 Tax=Salinicola tamaricis TaxID=1771309 RepID=UPI0030F3DA01
MKTPSLDVDFIRRRLDVVRERLGLRFRRMGEMTLEEVRELTALSAEGHARRWCARVVNR